MFQVGCDFIMCIQFCFVLPHLSQKTMVKKEYDSKDLISDIQVSVDVTLATDDDKQLKAQNKSFTNQ